jgi:hypothetical protein
MALVQITTSYLNDRTSAETLLLNTAKIVDFYEKDASNVIFYYKELEDRREKTNKYETALTKTQFEALFDETLYAARIDLPVLEISSPTKRTFVKTINVSAADVIKAKDIDASTSYLWFARGAFQKVKVKVNATISEIESASSTSVSIA